jgi:hypothetical protein
MLLLARPCFQRGAQDDVVLEFGTTGLYARDVRM